MAQVVGSSKVKVRKKSKSISSQNSEKPLEELLPKETVLEIHRLMVKSRVVEERMIKLYKMGMSYFWIGAPGEEAFGVPLGMLAKKGQGLDHDWFHLHYRGTPTLIAMGMPIIDPIRLTMNKATDRSTAGRNFSNHYCYPEWNIAPVSSPIEVQYSIAIGTAWSQRRHGGDAITVVTGGDAGSAEGDFASCLIWSSRPGKELPIMITVQNNRWGISTSYDSQHGEKNVSDRGKPFGIRTRIVNGNDPVQCYLALQEEYEYIRKNRKPSLVEFEVSRLYGHSSGTGANFVPNELDCLKEFERKLLEQNLISQEEISQLYLQYDQESKKAVEQAKTEPEPSAESIWEHCYANNENADWRKF